MCVGLTQLIHILGFLILFFATLYIFDLNERVASLEEEMEKLRERGKKDE